MTLRTAALIWGAFCAASILINIGLFQELWALSLKNEYASYIFLVPFMSAMLILRKRAGISASGSTPFIALVPVIAGY